MSWARIKRLAREAGWIVFGQVAAVIGSLVLVRVLTEQLTPETYGHLALGLTIAGLINQVVMGGLTAGIGRYHSIAAERQELSSYFSASQKLMGLAAVVVTLLGGLLALGLLSLGYSHWVGFAGLLVLLSWLSGYGATLGSILNAARRRALVAVHSGVDAWLKILLALAAIYCLGASEASVVAGYLCAALIVVASQYFFLRRSLGGGKEEKHSSRPWVKQIWIYAWPFSAWGLFSWAQLSSDRWALETFGATDEVGLYAVLFQLGYTPIVMVTGMVVSFIGPILYQRAGDASDGRRNASVDRLAWRIMIVCLALTLIAFLFAWGLHEWIFNLLVSPKYRSVSYLMPWMVVAGGLFAGGQMLALKLMSDMRASVMTSAKIGTALLGVVANLYGASIAGIPGVVASLMLVSAIYLLWMLLLVRGS